jgi:hypothetical protein
MVITINYNTVPDFHSTSTPRQSSESIPTCLHYPFPDNGSQPRNYHRLTLQISLHQVSLLITINTALPLFLHFMVHGYTLTSPLLVTQLKHRNNRFKYRTRRKSFAHTQSLQLWTFRGYLLWRTLENWLITPANSYKPLIWHAGKRFNCCVTADAVTWPFPTLALSKCLYS